MRSTYVQSEDLHIRAERSLLKAPLPSFIEDMIQVCPCHLLVVALALSDVMFERECQIFLRLFTNDCATFVCPCLLCLFAWQCIEIDCDNRVRIQLNGYWFGVRESVGRGWGIFADESVPCGHSILEYCGEMGVSESRGRYVMQWGCLYIDADPHKDGLRVGDVWVGQQGRAWMGLINEPKPSEWVTVKPGKGPGGLPMIKVVKPGGLIKGDELLMCYGDGRVFVRGYKHCHASSRCYGPRKMNIRALRLREQRRVS